MGVMFIIRVYRYIAWFCDHYEGLLYSWTKMTETLTSSVPGYMEFMAYGASGGTDLNHGSTLYATPHLSHSLYDIWCVHVSDGPIKSKNGGLSAQLYRVAYPAHPGE